jgi:hypothetical protein
MSSELGPQFEEGQVVEVVIPPRRKPAITLGATGTIKEIGQTNGQYLYYVEFPRNPQGQRVHGFLATAIKRAS